jgi:hypothetical protein
MRQMAGRSAADEASGRNSAGAAHPTVQPAHSRRGEAQSADAAARCLRAQQNLLRAAERHA